MTPEEVIREYGRRLNLHSPDDVVALLAEDAVFWFNDGSYEGVEAIRAALATVWRTIRHEQYELKELRWLCRDDACAVCVYRFYWSGMVGGEATTGQGRGTSVLRKEDESWLIVHEHLSTPV